MQEGVVGWVQSVGPAGRDMFHLQRTAARRISSHTTHDKYSQSATHQPQQIVTSYSLKSKIWLEFLFGQTCMIEAALLCVSRQ